MPRATLLAHPLTRLAVVGETVLALVALSWAAGRGIPLAAGVGPWYRDAAIGAVAAVALAGINYGLLCRAPDIGPVRAIRRVAREILRPMCAGIGGRDVVIVAVAAGVGEELLFRGALQPEVGLVPASLVFGALHMGGRGTLAFGVWVSMMGAALGGLAELTGGLLAPIVAHALYDAGALAYLRWGKETLQSPDATMDA